MGQQNRLYDSCVSTSQSLGNATDFAPSRPTAAAETTTERPTSAEPVVYRGYTKQINNYYTKYKAHKVETLATATSMLARVKHFQSLTAEGRTIMKGVTKRPIVYYNAKTSTTAEPTMLQSPPQGNRQLQLHYKCTRKANSYVYFVARILWF